LHVGLPRGSRICVKASPAGRDACPPNTCMCTRYGTDVTIHAYY
jgi:hypothetical protein